MSAIQYTIRGVPAKLDMRLRRLARLRDQSLNQIIIEQLSQSSNVLAQSKPKNSGDPVNTDFDDLFGNMTPLGPDVEAALKAQRKVDSRDWQTN